MAITAVDLYKLSNFLFPPFTTASANTPDPTTPDGTVANGQQYWTALIEGLEDGISNLDGNVVQPLNSAWQGLAAELASQKIQQTGQDLVSSVNQLKQVRSLLDYFWQQLTGYVDQLVSNLLDEPLASAFTVTSAGFVLTEGRTFLILAQNMVAQKIAHDQMFATPPDFPQPAAGAVVAALNSVLSAPTAAKLFPASWAAQDGTQFGGTPITAEQKAALSPLSSALKAWADSCTDYIQGLVADANQLDTQVADQLLDLLPDAPYTPPAGSLGNEYVTPASGQSLWEIAQQVYGDGSKWTLLADSPANSWITDPSDIPVGKPIWVPPIPGPAPAS